jgi:NTE family protein
VFPPVTINGRRWMDGGVRSIANADLAAPCEMIVVLAPISVGFGPMPTLAAQVAGLRKHAAAAVVSPDQRARRAIGLSMLDPARRVPAARAGHAQAQAVAANVAAVWAHAGH